MKALALDTSLTRITICAKNDDAVSSLMLDIGMKQSEKLLPSIEYVLSQVGLKVNELDYTTLCKGPGSFTGLRLAFSALKALELSYNIPIYGIGTLDAYSFAYKDLLYPTLCVVDAKKNRFYAKIQNGDETILDDGDFEIEFLVEQILSLKNEVVLICGSDSKLFLERIAQDENLSNKIKNKKMILLKGRPNETENLFEIAEEMIAKKIPALKDFEGPVYIRASEAEENLNKPKEM